MNNSNHSNILIIGGGCAGISVATRLKSLKSDLTISIIEPSEKSLYQAAWTLVGAGAYDVNSTIKPMSSVMPSFVNWIKEYAESFAPESNLVMTKFDSGAKLSAYSLIQFTKLGITEDIGLIVLLTS